MIDNLPETLAEAVDMLTSRMSEEDKTWFRSEPDAPAMIHHGPGTALRNDWGLWDKEAPLSRWFRGRGLWHPDDFSGIVYDATRARLRGEPFDLDAEIAYYTEFWRQSGVGFDGVRIPDHKHASQWLLRKGADGKWRRVSEDS